jgi:hypothetical protein
MQWFVHPWFDINTVGPLWVPAFALDQVDLFILATSPSLGAC